MTAPFNTGDLLECIDNSTWEHHLTLGKVYKCLTCYTDGFYYSVNIETDKYGTLGFFTSRFTLYLGSNKPKEIDYIQIAKDVCNV